MIGCRNCLYHLPDADEWVCVNEDSPLYNEFTEPEDVCEKHVKHEKYVKHEEQKEE